MKTWADYGISFRRFQNTRGDSKERCPQCKDPNSLSVNRIKETWLCHSCNWKGGLTKFGVQRPSYKKPALPTTVDLDQGAMAFLSARNLDPEVILKHKLISRQGNFKFELQDLKADCQYKGIAYPIYKYGELVNILTRRFWFSETIDARIMKRAKWFFTTSCEQPLLNTDNIDWDKPIYWVEGYLDGLALETVGVTNWVSLPNGSPKPEQSVEGRLSILEDFMDRLEKCPGHILFLDNDAPGQYMTKELSRRLDPKKCSLLDWPSSNFGVDPSERKLKDAGDILQLCGSELLKEFIDTCTIPFPLYGAATRDEVRRVMMSNDSLKADAKVGIPEVDRLFSLQLGYVHIHTGSPNIGKSTLVSDFIRRISEAKGWHNVMFSAEDSLRSITQRISSQFLDKAYYELDPDEKEFASTWINQHFTFIKTEDITTLDQIMSLTEGLIRQKGIRVLVIDPWNKIENERLALGMDAIEYLAWGLNKLSRFAKKYMLAVVIVAHPPMLKSANGHIREVQSYYDINGGAQWGNIGDIISASNPVVGGKPMGLGYLPSKFSVFKVRERPELGDIGEVELCFNPKTKRFISKDEFYQLQYEHVHRDTEAAKANSTNTTPISESSSNHEIEVTTKVTIFDDPNIEEGVIE